MLVAVAAGIPVLAALPPGTAGAGSLGATTRVSVSSTGAQGTGGSLAVPSLSDDARFVAFHSRAIGLVPNDTNAKDDAFVHDRVAGTTTRVSVSTGGAQGNDASFFPRLSADGRFVVFGSGASNLVPGDTNADPPSPTAEAGATGRDVFVHDRATGTTTRESLSSTGEEGRCFAQGEPRPCGGGAAFAEADISDDGRFVAFAANAQNLVPGDTNNQSDVFVRDRSTGTTTRVSVVTGGAQGCTPTATGACPGAGASVGPSISADGRFVTFQSAATYLATGAPSGDTNGAIDVFVHDRETATTSRVSVATGRVQATGGASTRPAISGEGRFVAFTSLAENLVPGDTNDAEDVFLHDRSAGTTTRVSVGAGGVQASDGSQAPSINKDGRFVSFHSAASNLVTGDTNSASDVFVHDRSTGTTTRASVANDLAQAEGSGSFFSALDAVGRFVAFSSDAPNLVPGDTNDAPDVFVHDRTLPTPFSTGYRLVASDGGIFAFGDAPFFGSTGAIRLNQPIVGMASTPRNRGYWMVASDGGIFAFGDAGFFGSSGAIRLNRPIVGMASTPLGQGYWMVASDGGIFSFGDARFFGSTGALRLNKPIVGMASTPSGKGYWLVASDGGIFAFGDARFFGSTGALTLNKPIVGMETTPSGKGYWLVASDGGIFAFGDARFFGSTGALSLNQPIVGVSANPSGQGYWLVASDGGIFAFGDARFFGSTGAIRLNKPITGMAAA